MKNLILPLFVLINVFSLAHPLKTAITDFTYLKEKKEVHIKINLFEDDFEAQLSSINNKKIELDRVSKKNSAHINSYISKNFKVRLNGKSHTVSFIRYTVIDDPNNKVISVDFIIKNIEIKSTDKLTLTNTILFDAEKRQSNPVRIDQFNNNKCRHLEFDLLHPTNIYVFR